MYAIVDTALCEDAEGLLEAVLRGGVRLVQFRAKSGVDTAVVRRLHRRTQKSGAILIVNDDPAAAVFADGLHVGQEDLVELGAALRDRLSGKLLGISCGTPDEARAAVALGADYLGVGPFAATRSKPDAGPPIGASGVAAVVRVAGPLPVAAIGGIGLEDVGAVLHTGARMAVVLSALLRAGDPEAAARALVMRYAELSRV